MKRVDMIKGVSGIEGSWNFPPVIANITHAFDNGLCGHAQALSQLFQLLFSYAEPYGPPLGPLTYEGLYKGLSPFGEKVILRMLNLDEVSKDRSNPGRRIIPDIKHMSTKTRKRYYEMLDDHNANAPQEERIPVIMSHAAVNGHPRLDDFLEAEDLKEIDSHNAWEDRDTFNPSGLNLFDDEILRIHNTRGLIGIIMDQRVLAGGKKLRALKGKIDADDEMEDYFKGKRRKRRWATLVLDQIEHIIRTVKDTGRSDWRNAWNIICIGSDFDGQIDPIDAFKKSTDFKDLRRVLRRLIRKDSRFNDLLDGVSTELVLDKISSDNVFNFLRRNY
jgi:microsomal dipeptidase-like Zn-dependent dipeptidase